MEGEMCKWTNYWNGWQPRWFILNSDGILSYYKSLDEVDQGCKGSMNLAACEIVVHSTDKTRLDIIVHNEQYIYLRVNNEKDRQKWLVALGTAKAASVSSSTPNQKRASMSPGPSSSDEMKAKKSELRLYCDLLMQQVHTVKESVADPANIDKNQLEEGSNLLAKTCDTFIGTLDDTLQLLEEAQSLSRLRVGDAVRTPRISQSETSPTANLKERIRQTSCDSNNSNSSYQRKSPTPNGFQSVFGPPSSKAGTT